MTEIHKKAEEEEIKLVEILNTKYRNQLRKIFELAPYCQYNIYAVRVKTKKRSVISEKKIFPKADAFLISTKQNLETNYISDRDLSHLDYEPIPNTGISIKQKGSKNFTIVKMSPLSFKGIFGNTELGAAASLYTNPGEKNKAVLEGWCTTWDKVRRYLIQEKIFNSCGGMSLNSSKSLKVIKQKALKMRG